MKFTSTKAPLWSTFSIILFDASMRLTPSGLKRKYLPEIFFEQWNNHYVSNDQKTSLKLPLSPDENHYPTVPSFECSMVLMLNGVFATDRSSGQSWCLDAMVLSNPPLDAIVLAL